MKRKTKYNIIIDEPYYYLSLKTMEKIIKIIRKEKRTHKEIKFLIDSRDSEGERT